MEAVSLNMKYAIRIADAPLPVWVEAIYPDQLQNMGLREKTGLGVSYFYTDSPRRATLYTAVQAAMESETVEDPTEIITENELQVYIIMQS